LIIKKIANLGLRWYLYGLRHFVAGPFLKPHRSYVFGYRGATYCRTL